ncbi:MAG: universal stress protein [Candidatus Kapaibacterium sp.]
MHNENTRYASILLPMDFSPCSLQARSHAMDFAKTYASTVHVLYVVEPLELFTGSDGIEQSVYFDVMQSLRRQAEERMRDVVDDISAEGVPVVSAIREGRPSDVIADYAAEHGIALICLSTHGRSGLNHLVLGSTTEHVLRKATCPVFVVRCASQG